MLSCSRDELCICQCFLCLPTRTDVWASTLTLCTGNRHDRIAWCSVGNLLATNSCIHPLVKVVFVILATLHYTVLQSIITIRWIAIKCSYRHPYDSGGVSACWCLHLAQSTANITSQSRYSEQAIPYNFLFFLFPFIKCNHTEQSSVQRHTTAITV